jgi:predicted site-specific integrase-resolvase
MVDRVKAAELLGIHPATLDDWYQRGWIVGKVKVSNSVWYPKTEVTKARRWAEKRKGKRS